MNERGLKNPRQDDPRQSESLATLLTIGGAATVLLLGTGAVYFLTVATPEALAMTAAIGMAVGLGGLLVMACVVAAGPSRAGRGGGGPGGGRPDTVPIPTGDSDAELFRILDDARLGDLRLTRRAPLHDRRGAA